MLVVMLVGVHASGADPAGNAWTNEAETNVVASRPDAPTIGSRCLSERLEDQGIELGLGLTNVNQQTMRGGLSRHRRAGRLSGSYDLELTADLERLLGFES